MTSAETDKSSIAYSSAATFMTTLDHLNAVGIPNLIDRNALPPSFSGSSKYEILNTFRFFTLIDKGGKPDRDLLKRVVDPNSRNDALLELLQLHYSGLFALPLASAGPTEIQRWFNDNSPASMVAKAKSFFLALAKQIGIPMHSMVSKGTRVATGSVRRKRRGKKITSNQNASGDDADDKENDDVDAGVETSNRGGETRSVALRGGAGSVSVSVTIKLWDLEGDDLAFVLGLMKALKAYEKGEGPAFAPGP